ncbi:MAG: hypothetical protein ACT4PI_04200 [Actinomycetota bacterium]
MSDDDRTGIFAGVGLAVAAALCCGLPLLIAAGALGALAGIGFGSWLLIAFGLVVIAGSVVAWRRRTRACPVDDDPARRATR